EDFLEDDQQRGQETEENEPRARQLAQRKQVRERRQQHVADEHHAEHRQHFLAQRNRAVAVIAVIAEQQHRPDDQNERVDLQVIAERKEAGGKTVGRKDRQNDVAKKKRREKRDRRQRKIGEIDDPRYQTPFLLKHRSFECTSKRCLCG